MAFDGFVDDGAPLWASMTFNKGVWTGPITGWVEHGPMIAWLGENGRFIGYVAADANTSSWVGSDPERLFQVAERHGQQHGLPELAPISPEGGVV